MAKLSDKQKKQIIAERINGASQKALAAKYHVSQTTIRRVLQSDPEMAQKVTQKKEENAVCVLDFMEKRKDKACGLIDKLMDAMAEPEKIEATSLNQLATSLGILIDKFTAGETKSDPDALRKAKEILGGVTSAID